LCCLHLLICTLFRVCVLMAPSLAEVLMVMRTLALYENSKRSTRMLSYAFTYPDLRSTLPSASFLMHHIHWLVDIIWIFGWDLTTWTGRAATGYWAGHVNISSLSLIAWTDKDEGLAIPGCPSNVRISYEAVRINW
jgi:hypothetical protein